MNPTIERLLHLNSEEFALLAQVLESERAKLLIEIRHTDHRAYREELHRRLTMLEGMVARFAES